jgi:hypothetical protein
VRERSLIALKSACLILAAIICLQLIGLLGKADPLLGIENSPFLARARAPAAAAAPAPVPAPGAAPGPEKKPEAEAAKKAAPPAPDARSQAIEKSSIFGEAPKKGGPARPALLGIAGDRAILRLPDGKVDLAVEGSEIGGVKVLRMAQNRVLVEYRGRKLELTIFSGLGSDSLSEKSREKAPGKETQGNREKEAKP